MEHNLGILNGKEVFLLYEDHTRFIKIGDVEFDFELLKEMVESSATVDKVTDCFDYKAISEMSDKTRLLNIIFDQQFEYWYDPCGKSGHSLDYRLTKRSAWALKRLFKS